MPKIDLNPQDWNEVCRILQIHAPDYLVWAFGSRVKRKAKAYSDLDLAIITQQPLSLSEMAILKEAFDDSNLPIRVDIVDWAATSPAFQKIIKQDKVLIQEGIHVMHTSHNLKSQRGAVLAFSLVMLLLLTLAGTRMIQQNKQQLEMANNMRLVTQTFADVEGFVADVKNTINILPQHIDPTGLAINDKQHQCIPTTTFKQNIVLAQTIDSRRTILSVRCFGVEDPVTKLPKSIQECSSYNETTKKVTCKGNTDCKTVDDAVAAFSASTDICYQDYDPQADNPNSSEVVLGKCPKEVHTIKTIATDAYGTTREIISDHVVGCGG